MPRNLDPRMAMVLALLLMLAVIVGLLCESRPTMTPRLAVAHESTPPQAVATADPPPVVLRRAPTPPAPPTPRVEPPPAEPPRTLPDPDEPRVLRWQPANGARFDYDVTLRHRRVLREPAGWISEAVDQLVQRLESGDERQAADAETELLSYGPALLVLDLLTARYKPGMTRLAQAIRRVQSADNPRVRLPRSLLRDDRSAAVDYRVRVRAQTTPQGTRHIDVRTLDAVVELCVCDRQTWRSINMQWRSAYAGPPGALALSYRLATDLDYSYELDPATGAISHYVNRGAPVRVSEVPAYHEPAFYRLPQDAVKRGDSWVAESRTEVWRGVERVHRATMQLTRIAYRGDRRAACITWAESIVDEFIDGAGHDAARPDPWQLGEGRGEFWVDLDSGLMLSATESRTIDVEESQLPGHTSHHEVTLSIRLATDDD
ncbi:MAG: hypothetical protein AB7K09_00185 [Planctomycetota bacterium]